ncbi:Hpt domain protein [Falsiruegeria litorea R37]|uniref:Hpt domain protein n=1 Tax=Falsiruegeria litorea R37 TaxID=1200284 RepID=A0A1Y5TTV9_9RHOB|nr:Hpt domain-containing protein [Falsiruegeria litorea]SLN69575.1 Hpt domain protein [Falsiruegeria litorea R37]
MIHWSRVNQLRDEVGAEDFREVVDLFLEEVEEVIDRLRADASRDALEKDLHFLKGSALSLGFESFSTLCQNGERQSASGAADTVDIDAIINTYEQSKTVFLQELPQHS